MQDGEGNYISPWHDVPLITEEDTLNEVRKNAHATLSLFYFVTLLDLQYDSRDPKIQPG